jgi:HprK-related kinase A
MPARMIVAELSPRELDRRLRGPGLTLRTGPFVSRINTDIAAVVHGVGSLYADHEVVDPCAFADWNVAMVRPWDARRWYRPQALFLFDGWSPFKPLPMSQAVPGLEWGLNWVIASHAHQYLMLHAAAVARGGRAAILPGASGSGKSTLCAALVQRGWRLLSDELAMVEPASGRLVGLARPISLKNQSIEVMRRFAPEAFITEPTRDTAKGDVSLMRPPAASVRQARETVAPAWVVAPRFRAGAAFELEPLSPAELLIDLGYNAFNYSILGEVGFRALADMADRCPCYRMTYGSLDAALAAFAELEGQAAPAPHVEARRPPLLAVATGGQP